MRKAQEALSGDDAAESLGEKLLADVKAIFEQVADKDAEAAKKNPRHQIRAELPTKEIVDRLVDRDDRPWPEMGKAHKPLTATRFTQMLGRFGIPRRNLVDPNGGPRFWGYRLTDFDDAFERHLDA